VQHTVFAPPNTLISENIQGKIVFGEMRSAFQLYEIEQDDRWAEALLVEVGAPLEITGLDASPMLRRVLETQNLEQYKEWIGVPDARIESGLFLPPRDLPQISPAVLERADLSLAEKKDLQRAFDYFVFGNSRVVTDYYTAISLHCSPFRAAVYACREVEILSGASLEFTNLPSILLIDRVVIHEGGSIKFFTPSKVLVGTLEKVGA
jgi:hypothetical protein